MSGGVGGGLWKLKRKSESKEEADAGGERGGRVRAFRKGPECGTRNTQTTTFMQEAGGRGAYYAVEHNVQVRGISIRL